MSASDYSQPPHDCQVGIDGIGFEGNIASQPYVFVVLSITKLKIQIRCFSAIL
jgi:hypothetical protein